MNEFNIFDLMKVIENNNDLLNRRYKDIEIEFSYNENIDGYWDVDLRIPTSWKRLKKKKDLRKIKKLFNAIEVNFIDVGSDEKSPCFWNITLISFKRRKEVFE